MLEAPLGRKTIDMSVTKDTYSRYDVDRLPPPLIGVKLWLDVGDGFWVSNQVLGVWNRTIVIFC